MKFADKEKLKKFIATRNYRKFFRMIPEGNWIFRNKSSKLVNKWVTEELIFSSEFLQNSYAYLKLKF